MQLRRTKKRPSRLRVLLTALLFTAIFGAIEFGEPLEDILRGIRNAAHPRPADGKIAIVALDDATFDEIGINYSEEYDARAVDALIAAGVRNIYFDRTFREVYDREGSQKLIETLKRNPGRLFFGVVQSRDTFNNRNVISGPADTYLPYVALTSLIGDSTPFGLSAEMHYADTYKGRVVPSISARIAGSKANPRATYRPDWTITAAGIPAVSYLDAINNRPNLAKLRGKDVIVGPHSYRIPDQYHIIGQGWVPGMYFHAIGAQTLREGSPLRVTWLFPYLTAFALAWFTLNTRHRSNAIKLYLVSVASALILPFVTDSMFITVDYVPAFLLYAIIAYRSHAFKAIDNAAQRNTDSDLPNLVAFRADGTGLERPIAALLIKNYERILAAYAELTPAQLLESITRSIAVTTSGEPIYHEDNTLYWALPSLAPDALIEHVEGLRALIATTKTPIANIDLDFTMGIDTQFANSTAKRINQAKIAATHAAAHALTYSISTAEAGCDEQWRLTLMSELDNAIANRTITVAYQPQLALAENQITGAEALVRWNHPLRGPISPTEFVAQAEATNRIAKLTFYVLDIVLSDLRAILHDHPDFKIGVNLSARLFNDPKLADAIIAAVTRSKVPISALKLEVTETATLDNADQATRTLTALSNAGASISIDDYGTGNATLEYLRSIPFNELKIDREFIAALATSDRDRLLVKSTIALAHALGHAVTAEGIEDDATLTMLKRMGCDRAQGYHISKALPIDKLILQIDPDRSPLKRLA